MSYKSKKSKGKIEKVLTTVSQTPIKEEPLPDLLPCPHCGHHVDLLKTEFYLPTGIMIDGVMLRHRFKYRISCWHCDMITSPHFVLKDLVEEWNLRSELKSTRIEEF